jgi:hypothetical protein
MCTSPLQKKKDVVTQKKI